MNSTKKAFTLIELLVVIAIIAILAAILFPVFAQAKAAAKKTSDLSNQKNIATSLMLYAGDADDMFPRQVYRTPGTTVDGYNYSFTWREALMPYIKNGLKTIADGSNKVQIAQGGIFDTPAKPGARGAYNTNRILTPGYCYWWPSSGNWTCDSDDNGVPNNNPVYPSVSMTALDAPASIMFSTTVGVNPDKNASNEFSDLGNWYWMSGALDPYGWPPQWTGPNSAEKWDADTNNPYSASALPRYRYNGGLNATFSDGHAKFVKKGALNWCQYMFVKGYTTDMGDSWDWFIEAGQPCAAWAR